MRGEDGGAEGEHVPARGSPPHARGRLFDYGEAANGAEDHPRMRGEDVSGP